MEPEPIVNEDEIKNIQKATKENTDSIINIIKVLRTQYDPEKALREISYHIEFITQSPSLARALYFFKKEKPSRKIEKLTDSELVDLYSEMKHLTVDMSSLKGVDDYKYYQTLVREMARRFAKNDLGVDCISRARAIERLKLNLPISQGADNSRDRHRYMQALADIQAIRELPSVTPQLSSELEKNSKKLEKDFGELDCINRDSAIKALDYDIKCFEFKSGVSKHMDDIAKLLNTIYETQVNNIKALPSVTPQEPQTFKWCTDCKEYDQENHCCHRWSKVIRDTVEEMKQEYVEREVLDKIREQIKDYLRGVEITLEVLVENDPLRPKMEGAKDTLEECLNLIDKAESEDKK